jgi:hypothetical protein
MLTLLLTALAAAAPCAEPWTTADLSVALHEAEHAFQVVDLPGFEAAIERARAAVPCLSGVVTPSLAARLHRTEGLSAFVTAQTERAEAAFASGRRIEPTYRFPKSLVPEGNPVLEHYDAAEPSTEVSSQPPPAEGSLRFDGSPSRDRPEGQPTMFQWVDGGGAPAASQYLWPEDPIPSYTLRTAAPPVAAAKPVTAGRGWPPAKTGLLATSGGTALLSAGLYLGAALVHARYESSDTQESELNGLRSSNNALVGASGASLGVSLGTGVAGLLVRR